MQLDNGVDVLLIDDSDRNGEDQPSSSEEQVEQNKSENSEKQGSKKNSEWLPPGVSDDDDEEYDPMCACAVVLKVGSFSDPQQLQVWYRHEQRVKQRFQSTVMSPLPYYMAKYMQ